MPSTPWRMRWEGPLWQRSLLCPHRKHHQTMDAVGPVLSICAILSVLTVLAILSMMEPLRCTIVARHKDTAIYCVCSTPIPFWP